MYIYMIVEQILMIHFAIEMYFIKVILNKNIYKIWMLYSLSILALKNSRSINHMGQWHTAFRLHELNFSVVGIIYRIGPQEYPLLVLQSDYLEQSFRKKNFKIWGSVSQHVWHERDPSMTKRHNCTDLMAYKIQYPHQAICM